MATETWAFRLPRRAERAERLAGGARRARIVVRAVPVTLLTVAFALVMAVFVPNLFGYKLMAVTSGSMAPSIHVGDAVYVREVEDAATAVSVGDVVTYRNIQGVGMTTHRVLGAKRIDGEMFFQTKGDANRRPDIDLTPASGIYGVLAMRLPAGGPVLQLATGRWGKAVLLGFPAVALMISEIGRIAARRRRSQSPALPPSLPATPPAAEPVPEGAKPTSVFPRPLSAEWPTPRPRHPASAGT